MSSLKPVCVSCPAADRQAGPKQADLPPPNLSSMLIINPTYSTLPVSLHHKLTFFFFSFPSLSFSVLFSLTPPPLSSSPPPSCSKFVHVKIIDDEEYEKNKNFFLELAEPRMVDMSLQKGAVLSLFIYFLTTSLLSLSFFLLSSYVVIVLYLTVYSLPAYLSSSFTYSFITLLYDIGALFTSRHPPFILRPFSAILSCKKKKKQLQNQTIAIVMTVSPDSIIICIKREQGV